MFVRQRRNKNDITYTLMRTYRENGKVKQETLCNLYGCPDLETALIYMMDELLYLRKWYNHYPYHCFYWFDTEGGKEYLRCKEKCRKMLKWYDGSIPDLKNKVRLRYHRDRYENYSLETADRLRFLDSIIRSFRGKGSRPREVKVRKPAV